MNKFKNIADEHFQKTVNAWKNEYPDETTGIREDEFNEEGLLLKDLTKSEDGSLLCAKFIKIFSNGLKAVYILKFKNDALWDDVFYVERSLMNKKVELVKKLVSPAIVILYDIVSLFWCCVFIQNIIFNFSDIKIGADGIDNTINIIGGADIPTLIYKMGNVIGVVFPILFVLLSIATAFLLTVSVFKKKLNQKLNILLCIFSALALIVFMLIPRQTYYVSLYTLIRFHKIPLIERSHIFYMLISLAVIAFNLFSYIKCKREDIK